MNPTHQKQTYRSPLCELVELKLEGVVALSPLSDYEDGGDPLS